MIKAAVRNFFWFKMIQNQFLGKYITSQCSNLSSYLRPIQNCKLVIKFSNLSGTGRLIQACHCLSLRHYVTSVNIKNESRLVGYITHEDAAAGGSLIASFITAGIIKLIILMADCNPERSICQSSVTTGDSPVVTCSLHVMLIFKSSHLYLYSAFNNTDCVKALNSIKLEDRVSVMYNNKIKHSIFS